MSRLTRTAIGGFRIEEATDPEAMTSENWSDFLLPPLRAVEVLPRITLTEPQIARIRNGQAIDKPVVAERNGSAGPEIRLEEGAELAAVNPTGRLVAILTCRSDHLLWPTRNLPPEE
jgi:tRNA U55 pseudouridine synthase TruB